MNVQAETQPVEPLVHKDQGPLHRPGELRFVYWAIALTSLIFLVVSVTRHELLQSNLYDLGIFDQALHLISQGEEPVVTTLGFHIIGDHAAFILYPLALLYRLWSSVYWLFLVQAIALPLAAFPVYLLARDEGLSVTWARTVTIAFLLYPALFNINRYVFHPETIALPALLWAVLAARRRKAWQLAAAIAIVLSCKAVLSLTVLMLGVWFLFERRRIYGALVAAAGLAWYVISAHLVIPAFTGKPPAALSRYSYLGDSLAQVAMNVLQHPELLVGRFLMHESLRYMLYLVLPVMIALHWRKALPLLPAIPALFLNVLSTSPGQRDMYFQYSLPIFPFVFVWLIGSLHLLDSRGLRRWLTPRTLLTTSVFALLLISLWGYSRDMVLGVRELGSNMGAVKHALTLIKGPGGVLTTSPLAAQVAHRRQLAMTEAELGIAGTNLALYDFVLLDVQHPGWRGTPEFSRELIAHLRQDPAFRLEFEERDVYLFTRR